MRLVKFEFRGQKRFGLVSGETITDLGPAGDGAAFRDLLLGGAPPAPIGTVPFSDVLLLPPITSPGNKILALGWAYKAHQEETGHQADPFPFFFLKHESSLVGHDAAITRPGVSEAYDFEGEFAVVIGKPGRHIPESKAMAHVAGYSILMDGSVRDWQKHSITAGKNFEGSSSFGPWIITRDEVANPHDLHLTTRLNGDTVQEASTGQLNWTVANLVAYCSTFTSLATGDIISTGTPGGVGSKRTPPLWLQPGDRLEVEVSGVGTLSNVVVQEAVSQP